MKNGAFERSMGRPPTFTCEQLRDALIKHRGVQRRSAEDLGVSPKAVREALNNRCFDLRSLLKQSKQTPRAPRPSPQYYKPRPKPHRSAAAFSCDELLFMLRRYGGAPGYKKSIAKELGVKTIRVNEALRGRCEQLKNRYWHWYRYRSHT
jgi:hypothetical protein